MSEYGYLVYTQVKSNCPTWRTGDSPPTVEDGAVIEFPGTTILVVSVERLKREMDEKPFLHGPMFKRDLEYADQNHLTYLVYELR